GAGWPSSYKYLNLTNVPQDLSNWCWAATATMVKNAVGTTPKVVQCAEASTSTLDCCPVPPEGSAERDQCNRTGSPLFKKADYDFIDSSATAPPILTWANIKTEIDAKRPFIFLRRQVTGGGHFFVVQGYSRGQGVRSILLNDPAPPGVGAVYWQTYSWYS